ncbi:hypothetical protein JCGZ_12092 [Jatropha curcas]|uniref:F-box domain-containing protein n=1 Tax=Jatropha curcas TaxID=180498 RepID=A0A067KKL2_JATCU|nr:putative F-box protein PP2-B12 [Jatropha curcas]KDP32800.1 hypothetical protein JCGZ_12092 [Jatropha curcas]
MSDLPEACIANILSFTDPLVACNLSMVSSTFRNAARSDTVWQRFLPPDCVSIISRSSDPNLLLAYSKKQLFFSLCRNPILIDDGKRSFSLEKWTGKKCFMLSARDLRIVWADTPRYWSWKSDSDSRFAEVAVLIDVCWLEISGKIDTKMLSAVTNYGAYLVFKLNPNNYGLQPPAEAKVGFNGSEIATRSVYLDFIPRRNSQAAAGYPKERGDGWMEVELGSFFNNDGTDEELEISVLEVKNGNWKRGLIVEGIEIRPKLA